MAVRVRLTSGWDEEIPAAVDYDIRSGNVHLVDEAGNDIGAIAHGCWSLVLIGQKLPEGPPLPTA